MRKIVAILVLLLVVFSCKKESELHKYMINKWQTTHIKIVMPTYTNSDSTSVNKEDFTSKMATVPQSEYYKDGTYKSWYLSPNGGRIGEISGNWSADDTNLYLDYTFADNPVHVSYKVTKTNEGFKAVSINDWDFDGVKDDTLHMKAKYIKK